MNHEKQSTLTKPQFVHFFFFLFRTPAVKTFRVKIMQLVSPVSQSRDINACALLDSKENIAKKVNYRMCS